MNARAASKTPKRIIFAAFVLDQMDSARRKERTLVLDEVAQLIAAGEGVHFNGNLQVEGWDKCLKWLAEQVKEMRCR